jgi:uncharacterized membrane protein YfcA
MPISILAGGLFVLAVVSGMLGLGVAFGAVPFLGLFLPDLVHQVQPLSLVLNGVTALFSTFGFARSGHVIWKHALALAVITTLMAPIGVSGPGHPSAVHLVRLLRRRPVPGLPIA